MCLFQHRPGGGRALRKNEVGLERDKFHCEPVHRRDIGCRPANVDFDVATLRPSELSEFLSQRRDPGLRFMVLGNAN